MGAPTTSPLSSANGNGARSWARVRRQGASASRSVTAATPDRCARVRARLLPMNAPAAISSSGTWEYRSSSCRTG
ncbi:hypothetical protein SAMN04489832_3278 [Micromonospora cremea]|uniref:Uncharacterized protein n=1 Tax=Micromonospora cremea TaxID=709881 RepID=A0A1N5YUD1_9ACTN|nr:hypothetical protein SAMN04489832_3278 [Micromonospora cremea]